MNYYILAPGATAPPNATVHYYQSHVFIVVADEAPPAGCTLAPAELFSDFLHTLYLDTIMLPWADPATSYTEALTAFEAGPRSYMHFLCTFIQRVTCMGRASAIATISAWHANFDERNVTVTAWDAYLLGLGQPTLILIAIDYYFAITPATHWQLVARLAPSEYATRPNLRNDYQRHILTASPRAINCYLTVEQRTALLELVR
jgi:hypothetical protein